MILSFFRRTIDKFVPSLGYVYRSLRDVTVSRRPKRTEYGFTLAGEPRIASSNWEKEEADLFLGLLEEHDVVLDIGANIGLYACLAASHGKEVMAFEPSPRNLRFLYQNLWENGMRKVEVFPLGLGKEPGIRRLYGFSDMASLVRGWAQAGEKHSRMVSVTSLDRVVGQRFRGSKLLIKLDVEGFELEVLGGAEETLDLTPKPTWLVEVLLKDGVIPGGVNTNFTGVFDVFWRHGYQCRAVSAERQLIGREDVTRWAELGSVDSGLRNFLFSKSEETLDPQTLAACQKTEAREYD